MSAYVNDSTTEQDFDDSYQDFDSDKPEFSRSTVEIMRYLAKLADDNPSRVGWWGRSLTYQV
jgi:hypothetical protein